jgi:plastocyanin
MNHPVRRFAAALSLVLLAGALFAACGGGGDDGGNAYVPPKGASTQTITVNAGNFYFKPKNITATPGIATIEMIVDNNIHDFVFDGAYSGFRLEGDGGSAPDSKKIDLEPGTYDFYCSITGHRAAGMEGTLTVEK